MIYQAKSLIDGYRLGKDFGGFLYVAVPEKYKGQDVLVKYNGEEKLLKDFPKGAVYYKDQPDKFGGDTFRLAYFVWSKVIIEKRKEPEIQPIPFFAKGKAKESNIIGGCPDCKAKLFQFIHEKKPVIQCTNCGRNL